MNQSFIFLLKVFVASAAISLAIKYIGPFTNIPATAVNASILVFLPTFVMAIILGWRAWQYNKP